MCYDISFTVAIRALSDYFPDLIMDEQLEINFDMGVHIMGHTHGEHPIIYRNREDGKLHCKPMEWGCIPFYTKDIKAYAKQRVGMLNARSERILGDKSSYWNKIRNRRCLIPVSGIYEHLAIKGWKKKAPYFITLPDQPTFFLPGLYSVTEVPDQETGEIKKLFTFTLVTRSADGSFKMQNIHNDGDNRNRMPLMLPFDLSKKWVETGEFTEEEYNSILEFQMGDENIEAVPVYTIRSAKERPDGKLKKEYFEWDKLPPLGLANPD